MSGGLRIVVASDIEADSPRAHAINVFKTAGGFQRLGHEVFVLCRPASGQDDDASASSAARLYAEPNLRWCFAREIGGGSRTDRFGAWVAERAQDLGVDLVYARHFLAAVRCADAGLATIVETHAHPGDPNPELQAALDATARAQRPIAALATISHRLASPYVACGASADRVHIVADAVDVSLFEPPSVLPPAPWGPDHGPHVVYAGHLYDYKGVPTILRAAALCQNATFHLVGGLPEDIERVREVCVARGLSRVRLHGPQPHAHIPPWLWHADALLLPPSALHASAAWTSPVKLGEYLAAGPPIVASDIPALRDWVAEPEVRWFVADDAHDLARAIGEAVREAPAEADARRRLAMQQARRLSYTARAGAMLRAAGFDAPTGALQFEAVTP